MFREIIDCVSFFIPSRVINLIDAIPLTQAWLLCCVIVHKRASSIVLLIPINAYHMFNKFFAQGEIEIGEILVFIVRSFLSFHCVHHQSQCGLHNCRSIY